MIVDLARDGRADYLRDRTLHEILSIVVDKDRITLDDVSEAAYEGRVVPLIHSDSHEYGEDFERLLAGKYTFSYGSNVQRLNGADSKTVYVLPPQYAMTGKQGRQATVYGIENHYLNLDSSAVIRAVMGEGRAYPRGPLSGRMKQKLGWTPSRVYEVAFRVLREELQRTFNRKLVGIRWRNTSNGVPSLVTPTRAIEALEGRVLQDLAYFKLKLPGLRRAVDTGLDELGVNIHAERLVGMREKTERYEREITRLNIGDRLEQFDLTDLDLVNIDYMKGDGLFSCCMVPSSDGTKRYEVRLLNVPVLKPDDASNIWRAWNVMGDSTNPDRTYREGWRQVRPGPGDLFIDKSLLLALFSHQAKINRNPDKFDGKIVGELPFPLARKSAIDFYHTLKYRTVVADSDEAGAIQLRPLNHVEMDIELMRLATIYGFGNCFFTDVRKFNFDEDPLQYAAIFK